MVTCRRKALKGTAYWSAVRIVNKVLSQAIDLSIQRTGTDWSKITSQLSEFNEVFKSRKIGPGLYSGTDKQVAYLAGYSPRFSRALFDVLVRLYSCGLISRSTRVLDIGAGCGTTAISLAYLGTMMNAMRNNARIKHKDKHPTDPIYFDVSFVDYSSDSEVVRRVVTNLLMTQLSGFSFVENHINLDLSTKEAQDKLKMSGSYDLIILSGILNELSNHNKRNELLKFCSEILNHHGSLILIESELSPERSFPLRQECLRVCEQTGMNIYDPCLANCTSDYCWAYLMPEITTWPEIVSANWSYSKKLKQYRYSYIILRKDGLTRNVVSTKGGLFANNTSIDTDILLHSDAIFWDISNNRYNYLQVCDGSSEPVWIVPPHGSYNLNRESIYHLVDSSAKWSRSVVTKRKERILTLSPNHIFMQIACQNPAFINGNRFIDSEIGSLLVEGENYCGNNILVTDENGRSFEYDLAYAIEDLRISLD